MNIVPAKYKRSRQRERILEVLKETDSHPTANWIYDRLKPEFPDLSLGTVYRNLRILEQQGEIVHLDSGSTFDRFDARKGQHYHFICESCGKVTDLDMPQASNLDRIAEKTAGIKVKRHRIDFFGLCPDCARKAAG